MPKKGQKKQQKQKNTSQSNSTQIDGISNDSESEEKLQDNENDENEQDLNQKLELYQKFLNKNKINKNNVFDYQPPKVQEMVALQNLKQDDNVWGKISNCLGINAQFYAIKVDTLQAQSYNVQQGLKFTYQNQQQPQNQVLNLYIQMLEQSQMDEEDEEDEQQIKKKGQDGNGTIEKKIQNLIQVVQQNSNFNPFFQKMLQQFDECQSKSLMSNVLNIDQHLQLNLYDKQRQIDFKERVNIKDIVDRHKPKENILFKDNICPQLENARLLIQRDFGVNLKEQEVQEINYDQIQEVMKEDEVVEELISYISQHEDFVQEEQIDDFQIDNFSVFYQVFQGEQSHNSNIQSQLDFSNSNQYFSQLGQGTVSMSDYNWMNPQHFQLQKQQKSKNKKQQQKKVKFQFDFQSQIDEVQIETINQKLKKNQNHNSNKVNQQNNSINEINYNLPIERFTNFYNIDQVQQQQQEESLIMMNDDQQYNEDDDLVEVFEIENQKNKQKEVKSIKELKGEIWQQVNEDFTNDIQEQDKTLFSNVLEKLNRNNVSQCFIALLHIANENNLSLQKKEDIDDLLIFKQ